MLFFGQKSVFFSGQKTLFLELKKTSFGQKNAYLENALLVWAQKCFFLDKFDAKPECIEANRGFLWRGNFF